MGCLKKILGLTCALISVTLAGQGARAEVRTAYDGAAWRADYAQLKGALEKDYANLAWFGAPEGGLDLPALDRRTQAALAAARSDAEARLAIDAFVAAFHDGHFSILASLSPTPVPPPARLDRHAFDAGDMTSSCAALGFAPSSAIAFSAPFESLPGFVLRFDGVTSVYRAGIAGTASGAKVGIIRIQNFRMRAFPAACTLAWAKLAQAGQSITSDAVREAAYALWFDAFRDEIAVLRAEGVTALIVDVGNNSGGDDTATYFPAMLTDRPFQAEPLLMAASPTGAQYLDEAVANMDDALRDTPSPEAQAAFSAARAYFVTQKAQIAATACDMSWVWRERRPYAANACKRLVAAGFSTGYAASLPKGAYDGLGAWLFLPSEIDGRWGAWTGPVYVLTDGKTYSSAEMFAATVQDNGIGKTIGAKTGGDGCGFMAEAEPLVLGHSHLRLRMANCVRLRRDGTDEVAGVAPDLPVLPSGGEDDRQRAVRMLEAIAADSGRAP